MRESFLSLRMFFIFFSKVERNHKYINFSGSVLDNLIKVRIAGGEYPRRVVFGLHPFWSYVGETKKTNFNAVLFYDCRSLGLAFAPATAGVLHSFARDRVQRVREGDRAPIPDVIVGNA